MDDFDYSLHISDQDWDAFYQECEACNLLSPGLASREDSGMSDIDEMGCHLLDLTRLPASTEADLQIDGPPDCEGSPVDSYLSKYGIRSPEQVLSGSEEDLHLQTVNLFFEQLKSVTVNEQPLEQSNSAICQSEKMDHLVGLIDKQVIQSIVICPSGRNVASLKGEITKQGEADTWGSTALEKPIMATFTNAKARASDSTEREPVVGGESLSSQLITAGMKHEQEKMCYHLSCTESTELKQKPETKPPDKPKMAHMLLANGINVTDSNPAGESIAQLNTGNISDSNDSPVCQFPVSPSNLRRKRRKKKRMSSEPGEPGHGYEAQFRVHQSESEEERLIQREVINNTNFIKRDHSSLPRVKMSSVSFNTDNLPLCFNVASADLKCSKSLPLSFTTFGLDTKPQVGRTSMYNISKYTNDISLINSGQLKAEVCQKSILPLHIQEDDVEVNPIDSDSAILLRDTDCSPIQSSTGFKETLSESQSDKSAAGCQRKSLLSPNISSAADSTEPLSSSVSFNLAEGACKDVSCLGNEIDCCAFKSEQSSPSKWKMTGTSDTQQSNLSITENLDETESCSNGNGPKTFSQKGELVPPTDISQSQTFKISTDNQLGKINLEIKCCIPENTVVCDHGTDGRIQSMNYSSEISSVNTSLIQPEKLTEEYEEKIYNVVNEDANLYHAVEDKSIGGLCDETTRSNEHIHGLKIPEDPAVSDHRKGGHILSINNSSEISIVNTSENSTEEPKGKIYNNINKDANLYHAVKEKSIRKLIDKTTSSSEHINGLKIPEDPAVSDHGNDESHIKHIYNSSEVLHMNSSLIKQGSLTEESKSKVHRSRTEDVNLYHAVEEKSIGELNDKASSSSEHIHGLKIPEDHAVSDHRKDEEHMQSMNNSNERSIVNTSLIQPENSTEESEWKRYNSVNEYASLYHAVEDKIIGELNDKTTSSSEHIHDLKIPEDPAEDVSDHENDESHIQHIINSSELLNMNSSLIKTGNSTEESESKGHCSVNEDANLYHAVEDKSIGKLCDETTRSSENICGLKMPEHTSVSDHGKDESHIQSTNSNSSEVLNMNTTIIKLGNSTEESEVNGHSGVSEEDKSIGELCDHKEEMEMLSEDSPQNALADVSDLLSITAADSKSIDPESIVLNAPDQTSCPVYAISSFWNEMEKLTINDILRLRMIANAQHPSVLTQPEDGSIVDATDAADSGYFTQPDDSKPDRLSGDMSFISDLDEDFTQLQTPDCIKQEGESCELSSSPCSVTWENDSDPAIVGDDVVFVSSDTTVPEHLGTSNAQQCFRKICKNISIQNLQALESQPIRQMLRNASLNSIHSEVEDPFYHVNTSYTTCLSDDEEMDTGGISFSEIIQYFLGDNEPERCPSRADNNAESYLDETCTSVPEMYDHFFSEFDSRSFFSPFEDESGGKDKMVPIFSCTRRNHQFPEAYDYFFPDSPVHSDEDDDNASINVVTHKSTYPFEDESCEKDKIVPIFSCTCSGNHQFPEAYDYFFPDSPAHSDEDDENDNAPIKVVTHKSTNHYPVAKLDTCEHSNPEDTVQRSFFWTNLLSFRRVRRTGPSIPEEKSCSWALTPVKPFRKGFKSVTVMGPDDKPFPDTLYLNLENRIFQQLAEQQKICMEMQTVIADPRLDAPFLPLRQADMCLVCIAFASWVLKSASPGADTWKAALLANISALSAIRYLRRHKREEASGKTSLRQIEPA